MGSPGVTETQDVRLIVMDTGPLITLAVASSLDYLLYPGLPVLIPDAVLYEATRDSDALGAQHILDWTQAHSERVQTISTEVFFNYVQSREAMPGRREKDMGERAAIEVIHDGVRLAPGQRALLMTEDDKVLRRVLVFETALTAVMIPITTRDFLVGMEAAKLINSADEVYRRAEDGGRLASQRVVLEGQHERAREAVAQALGRSRS